MTIEELLKDAWLKSWEVSNFRMKYLFEEYLNKRQSAINQAKREVIEEFVKFYNEQNEEAYTIFPVEVEFYLKSTS